MKSGMNILIVVGEVRLHVERHGYGAPLLMIPGLGAGNSTTRC